ncbi:hypothetical protein [Lysobacter gummosus]|uniref:hypothetical protein n=1 Tax=Lysobacter gummosus TaxID=262324 RepID=UPI00362A4D4F
MMPPRRHSISKVSSTATRTSCARSSSPAPTAARAPTCAYSPVRRNTLAAAPLPYSRPRPYTGKRRFPRSPPKAASSCQAWCSSTESSAGWRSCRSSDNRES